MWDLEIEDAGCFYADGLLVHNCHHLVGTRYRDTFLGFDSWYRFGLSATIFLTRKGENETGTIWLKGSCGRVRYQLDPSELIRLGYLVKPTIEFHRVDEPDLTGEPWSEELYATAVTHNRRFNARVIRLAKEAIRDRGYRNVLIPCRRIEHCDNLFALARHRGLRAAVIIGSTPPAARATAIRQFKRGDLDLLIGTVFGEGVDIPEIECVINAEGMRSRIATLQRLRNMTPSEGKAGALMIEFAFVNNKHLKKHSLERLREYKRHGAFEIVRVRS